MKNTYKIAATISIVVVLLLASYGCGSGTPPQEEQKAAQLAMEQAKAVQADKFAPTDWSQASQTMADADKDVKINRYGDARMFYTRAKSRFENTYKVAKPKFDQYMQEADEKQTQINNHYNTVKLLLAKAPAKAKKEFEPTFAEFDKSLAEIEQARSSGNAIKAKQNADDLLKKVWDTERSLQKK